MGKHLLGYLLQLPFTRFERVNHLHGRDNGMDPEWFTRKHAFWRIIEHRWDSQGAITKHKSLSSG
jgi:hypothetical protein